MPARQQSCCQHDTAIGHSLSRDKSCSVQLMQRGSSIACKGACRPACTSAPASALQLSPQSTSRQPTRHILHKQLRASTTSRHGVLAYSRLHDLHTTQAASPGPSSKTVRLLTLLLLPEASRAFTPTTRLPRLPAAVANRHRHGQQHRDKRSVGGYGPGPCLLLLQSRGAGLALRTGLRLRLLLLLLPLLGLRLADLRGDLHKRTQVQGRKPAR